MMETPTRVESLISLRFQLSKSRHFPTVCRIWSPLPCFQTTEHTVKHVCYFFVLFCLPRRLDHISRLLGKTCLSSNQALPGIFFGLYVTVAGRWGLLEGIETERTT